MKSMCHGEKVVHVSVYVARTRRRKALPDGNHHRCHVHRIASQHRSGGYDRKAELLLYCHQLRALAHSEQISTIPTSCKAPHDVAHQIVPVPHRKPTHMGTPTCFDDWKKILAPACILKSPASSHEKKKKNKMSKSTSIGNKMNVHVKSLTMEKQPGFVKKLLSAFRKHHDHPINKSINKF